MNHGVIFSFGSAKVCSPAIFETCFSFDKDTWIASTDYCIPDAKRGYYGFIIVVVRVRRDFLLATYSPHFFPDFFHIWQVS